MPINQNQIRDLSIVTVADAALVGRPKSVAFIAELHNHFSYQVNSALVDDGANIIPAVGTNAHWVIIGKPSLKDNLVATVAPTATDDSSASYGVGSTWINVTADTTYMCVDSTAAAAIWHQIDRFQFKNNSIAIVAPSATDDSAAGYAVGSMWIDTAANSSYVCVDSTATTAIWNQIDATGLKSNLAATVAPSATDDSAAGYAVGSMWIDTTSNSSYVCVDSTATSAVWNQIDATGLKNNLAATVAPSATDDSAAGYAVGSMWIDTAANSSYVCVDSTATSAVWNQIDATGLKSNLAATVAPSATDDSAAGYAVGSMWIDTTANSSYVCVDSTATTAIWNQIDGIPFKSNLTSVTQPSITDDLTAGYSVGSIWHDTTFGIWFIAKSVAAGAAVWIVLESHKYGSGISNPTPSNDRTQNYSNGSMYYNNVTGDTFICVNNAIGAANWQHVSAPRSVYGAGATVPPSVTDDINSGYQLGSVWIDSATDTVYVCVDSAAGAAIWLQTNNVPSQDNLTATVDPSATDDSAAGYAVGSMWINTAANTTFICVDSTATTAIWNQIDGSGLKSNLSATVPPSASATTTAGYAIGSMWVDVVADIAYICVDATVPIWNRIDGKISLKDTLLATTNPTATADLSAGYGVGSMWINTLKDESFICVNNTSGAAIWHRVDAPVTPQDNLSATVAPTTTDDTSIGYSVGSTWADTTANKVYICVDATAAAAIWRQIDTPPLKDNLSAVVNPDGFADNTLGYAVGSMWVNVTLDNSYICIDSTTSTAIWHQLDSSSIQHNFTATLVPNSTTDSTVGYSVGSLYLISSVGRWYVATDVTPGAAVWVRMESHHYGTAQTIPGPTTDQTLNYSVGSLYYASVTDGVYICTSSTVGAATWVRVSPSKRSLSSTLDPVATDDSSIGYDVGSMWVNVSSKQSFICVDATASAAIWHRIDRPDLHDNLSATAPPTTTSDTARGYFVGSTWIDIIAKTAYICVDATTNAAVWDRYGHSQTYSTTTVLTGDTWIDGRPIYRTVVKAYSSGVEWTDTNGVWTKAGITGFTTVSDMVKLEWMYNYGGNWYSGNAGYYTNVAGQPHLKYTAGTDTIYSYRGTSSWGSAAPMVFILEYTII